MQFKTLFTASLLSGLAAAAPKATCTSEAKAQATGSDTPKAFGLVALRSASPIHFSSFSASQSGFDLKLPKDKQGAKCDGKDEGTATFTIKDGELFLYSTGKEQQIAYTDRSGMGQGVLQYTKGKSYPRNAETKGWKIDDAGNLVFGQDNASFVACDNGVDGSWSVWVATGVEHPGNTDKECLGFNARVAEIEKPVSCEYSQYDNSA